MTGTDIKLFDYELPETQIAQYPAAERDGSRLLVVDRGSGLTENRFFHDLPDYLRAGDVLVLNDSKVVRARLFGTKESTGAAIEFFVLKQVLESETQGNSAHSGTWSVLAKPARRLKPGDRVLFPAQIPENGCSDVLAAVVIRKNSDGTLVVSFEAREAEGDEYALFERFGHIPLPPYIRRPDAAEDAARYQTVYAAEAGSAAAPTAGLHFTEKLLEKLREKGVETVFITLHVGLGTFRPLQEAIVENHQMHTEDYYISEEASGALERAHAAGRRIFCVGTTSLRAMESAGYWDHEGNRCVRTGFGSTDIFFYPGGRKILMANGLITNFHLPKSTLLMLVSAFYDREKILRIYQKAIEDGYRFFSYGDAMLIF